MSTTSPLPERDNQQKQTGAEPMTKVTERTIAFVIDASASRASSESEGKQRSIHNYKSSFSFSSVQKHPGSRR
jgi:hypothetical protein